MIRGKILEALEEKELFIGYYQLCRYLNGKGYKRYGCNAGYPEDSKLGNDRLSPCKILCPQSEIYLSKLYYWVKKLEKQNKVFTKKIHYYDSNNPNTKTKPHKTDIFVLISKNKESIDNFIKNNTLLKWCSH